MTAVDSSPSHRPPAGPVTAPEPAAPDLGTAATAATAGYAVPGTRARPWLVPLGLGLGTLAATAYTAALNPDTSHAFPLCPLRMITGYDCPACGCLRAVHSLTHGDIIGAADHNILFVALTPVLVIAYLAWLGRSLGWRIPRVRIPRTAWIAFLVVVVVFGVVRNLPIPGHALLNSTAHLAGRAD